MDWVAILSPLLTIGAFWVGRWLGYRRGHEDGVMAEYIRQRLMEDEYHLQSLERRTQQKAPPPPLGSDGD